MTQRKPQGAFFERAPNILMEKIAELNSALTNYRNNGHSAEVLKLHEEVLDAMQLAHLYMEQTKFIHHRNALLESSYRYLAYHNKELLERLNEYEPEETLTQENLLEGVIGVVKSNI